MSEYDGVDSASTAHTIEWRARLTYGGHLWAEPCPYCGNETLYNVTATEFIQVVTTDQESAEDPDLTRYEPDDRGSDRLVRVTCGECAAVLLDRDNPADMGPVGGGGA